MVTRTLGTTGFSLSPLGFGAFKIGRNTGTKYAQGYDLPSENDSLRLVRAIIDLGINYLDTAPAYGISEQRIGAAITPPSPGKSKCIISTKVGETFVEGKPTYDFSKAGVRASIKASRSKLGLETLDLVFIHAHGDDLSILNDTEVVIALQQLKGEGVIRAIGFSGKTIEGAAAALDWADAIMVEYHLDDRSHEAIIAEAAQRGVGVVVKKGLASGNLNPKDAIEFVLSNKGVTSLVVGGLNLEHIRLNYEIAKMIIDSE